MQALEAQVKEWEAKSQTQATAQDADDPYALPGPHLEFWEELTLRDARVSQLESQLRQLGEINAELQEQLIGAHE